MTGPLPARDRCHQSPATGGSSGRGGVVPGARGLARGVTAHSAGRAQIARRQDGDRRHIGGETRSRYQARRWPRSSHRRATVGPRAHGRRRLAVLAHPRANSARLS